MNYQLDNEEKQLLQMLETVNNTNNFVKKNASATESIHNYNASFDHNDARCSIIINKKGELYFKAISLNVIFNKIEFRRTYHTHTTKWFGFIKTHHMNYNHPLIKAALKTYNLIMQTAEAVDKRNQKKFWEQLLNS